METLPRRSIYSCRAQLYKTRLPQSSSGQTSRTPMQSLLHQGSRDSRAGCDGLGKIITLLSNAISLFEADYEIYEAAPNAGILPGDFRVAANCIPLVIDTLELAKEGVQQNRGSDGTLEKAVPIFKHCEESAIVLNVIFSKSLSSQKSSQPKQYRQSLDIKRQSKKVRHCMEKVTKNLQVLAQHQLICSADLEDEIKAAIEELANVSDGNQKQSTHYVSGDINNQTIHGVFNAHKCSGSGRQWIATTMNFGPDAVRTAAFFNKFDYNVQRNVNQKRLPGTCQWASNHTSFESWKNSNWTNILWITGDPKCGKSVLSRALVDEKAIFGHGRTMLYFFFKDAPGQNCATAAILAMLHQTFLYVPELFEKLAIPVINLHGERLKTDLGNLWKLFALALELITVNQTEYITCIFDGIDDCLEPGRSTMINCIDDYHTESSFSSGRIKFLFTSRPYDHLERVFRPLLSKDTAIRLRGEDETDKICKDVALVVSERIQTLELNPHMANFVRKSILSTENRTYLWAQAVLDEIEKSVSKSHYTLMQQIHQLPDSIKDIYEGMLSKSLDRRGAKLLLSLVVVAKHPPTLGEIDIALSITRVLRDSRSSGQHTDLDDRREHENIHDYVRQACGLFLTVMDSRVYLIHQSAKDFLLAPEGDSTSDIQKWEHSIFPEDASRLWADINTYHYNLNQSLDLRQKSFTGDLHLESLSLLGRAAGTWPFYLRRIMDAAALQVVMARRACTGETIACRLWKLTMTWTWVLHR